jgi:hypothetical protein
VNEWNWFRDSVTAMRYFVHTGAAQSGTVFRTPDAALHGLPILQGLDSSFTTQDEWYEFDYAPLWGDTANWNASANVRVLLYLNEATLATPLEHPMKPHPMAWIREAPGGNRFFYTSLVHTATGANSDFMHSLLLRALEYAAGHASTSVGPEARMQAGNPIAFRPGEITVAVGGPFALDVRGLDGTALFSAKGAGTGPETFRAPENPGLYVIRVMRPGQAKEGFSRILVVP